MKEREAMDALRGINRDITDEQEAAKALRLSETKLKLGMAVAGLGLGAMDYLAGQITLDVTAAALFALPSNTPIPRGDVHDRFHPDDAPSITALMTAALTPTGSGFMSVDHRIVRPDGSTRWVAARKQVEFSSPSCDGMRRATTGLLAVLDITDRKVAEVALKQSEERYRSALNAGRLGTWETNLLAKTRMWSPEGMALFGLTLADGRGQVDGDNDEFVSTLHPDDRHLQQHFNQQADLQDSFAAEYRIIRPDGTIRWLSGHGHVVARGPDGKAHHLVNIVTDITDRKVAEEKVRVSEIRYRRLFEAAHDGVLLVDPATRKIVDANPFMTMLLGYPHDQLVGKELFEIGLLKDEAASRDMFLKLNQTHQVRYEDLPLESQDGRQREVEVVANLYDEGGHSIIQCNIRDITERRQSEALSRQNAALFTTLVEQAPTGVYVIDSQFRMQQVNALALPVFKAVHSFVGRDFSEILHIVWGQDVGDQIVNIFRHTLETGERYISPPFCELRADLGVIQAYEWETQRVILADGKHGVVCYFTDVTERKLAENEVVEREAHVRSILDNTMAFVGLLDLDGVLLEANAPALHAGGISRKSVIGKNFWDAPWWTHDPAEVVRLKDAIARAAKGEIVRYDVVARMAGDTRMDVDFMISPVRDGEGRVTLLVPSGLDVTERKRALHHIEFLMGEVNHRSMNLLGVVLAIARQMARGGDPVTFVARLTDRISGLAASQDLLVQNQWEGVALPELIEAQLAHFSDLFGRRVLIDGPPARLTPVAAQGIGMALHELATNASKYGSLSTSHGRVRISWRITDAKEPRFTMHWVEENGPKIASPTRMGFGQKVIGPMVEAAVNGNTEVHYGEDGFSWKLNAPVADSVEGGRGNSFAFHGR
jgi:PAS domain S-box-containing protein